jgi:excisionase family DNA binding protein
MDRSLFGGFVLGEGGFMVTEIIADALSITQAARRLGLSSERVCQLCNAGELESFRFGPGWRLIPAEAVEELARARAARRNLELSNGGQD